MTLTPKTKIKLSIIVFILIFFLIFLFVINPFLTNIKDRSGNLASQKATLLFLEKQIANIQMFQNDYLKNQKVLDNLDRSFLNYEAPVEFFEFLEQEARRADIFLDASPSVVVSNEEEDEAQKMNFEVFAAGDFPNCLAFLQRLEKGPFLAQAVAVSIEKVGKNTERYSQFKTLLPDQVVFIISLEVLTRKKDAEQ